MSSLVHPLAEPPHAGQILTLAPGIDWLRLPVPGSLDHINLWLIEDGDGLCLIDTGMGTPDTVKLWENVIRGLSRPVTRIVSTHFHTDHVGMAGWLCERLGAVLWMTEIEYQLARSARAEDAAFRARHARLLRQITLPGPAMADMMAWRSTYPERVSPLPDRFVALEPDRPLQIGGQTWQVILAGGHTPAQACLYCAERGLLIAGDQILPRISSTVWLSHAQPEGDPLGWFMDSLDRFGALPEETLVLPSHGLPFLGLSQRIAELRGFHDARLTRLLAGCAAPIDCAEAIRLLAKRVPEPAKLMFAAGETLAYLNFLTARQRLISWPDVAGNIVYQASEA